MYATPVSEPSTDQPFLEAHLSANSKDGVAGDVGKTTLPAPPPAIMRPGTYRESNVEIGRAAEKKGITVREYDRGDRWLAWRKRAKKIKEAMLARAARANRKTKGKKSNKGANAARKR